MPELPEVETVMRGLQRLVLSRRITKVEILNPAVIAGSPDAFCNQIEGRSITGLARKGKAIALCLAARNVRTPVYLVIRLGMTGQVVVTHHDARRLPHTHVRMTLDRGPDELRYRDIRRFGRLRCCTSEELARVFRSMGPDALDISKEQFQRSLRGRRGSIKGLLLNQRIIAGLGNIYADEALFKARIHPQVPAGNIPKTTAHKLLESIRAVLRTAVQLQGTSFRDYTDIEGRPGNFRQRLCAYQRTGEPCTRCRTSICRIVVCGRSSHFCPRCQQLSDY